jgi:hypothetical protein
MLLRYTSRFFLSANTRRSSRKRWENTCASATIALSVFGGILPIFSRTAAAATATIVRVRRAPRRTIFRAPAKGLHRSGCVRAASRNMDDRRSGRFAGGVHGCSCCSRSTASGGPLRSRWMDAIDLLPLARIAPRIFLVLHERRCVALGRGDSPALGRDLVHFRQYRIRFRGWERAGVGGTLERWPSRRTKTNGAWH